MIVSSGFVEVRWYLEEELSELAAVHAICFPHEGWTARDFERFVAKRDGQVVKAIVLHIPNQRPRVIGSLLSRITGHEVRIARISVLPGYRRQGIGSQAIEELTGPKSVFKRRVRFTAYVNEQNDQAIKLFTSLKFKPPPEKNLIYNHFPGVGDDVCRDAIVFEFAKQEAQRRFRRPRHADC